MKERVKERKKEGGKTYQISRNRQTEREKKKESRKRTGEQKE